MTHPDEALRALESAAGRASDFMRDCEVVPVVVVRKLLATRQEVAPVAGNCECCGLRVEEGENIRKAISTLADFNPGATEFSEALETIANARSTGQTSDARDAELIRALRNQYVSERTFRFQCENGMDYENARAHAESAVNQFEVSFIAARERHAAMRQEGGSDE